MSHHPNFDGIAPEPPVPDGRIAAMPLGGARRKNMLLTGLLQAAPGAAVYAPLITGSQPLAAVLGTSSGAEIAMLSMAGFARTPRMDLWPVGVVRPSLTDQA